MSVETKEAIRAKIAQSRWFLHQTTDPSTAEDPGLTLRNWNIGY
jgi:hypothetical protein